LRGKVTKQDLLPHGHKLVVYHQADNTIHNGNGNDDYYLHYENPEMTTIDGVSKEQSDT